MDYARQKQPERKSEPLIQHKLQLTDRKELQLFGVKEVIRFDEMSVILSTTGGKLTVRGGNLKMGSLNVGSGELLLSGSIDALSYSAQGDEGKGLKKLFR